MHHPIDRIAQTTAFVTSIVEHWLEQEIAQWVRHERLIRRQIGTMSECSYHGAASRSNKLETTKENLFYRVDLAYITVVFYSCSSLLQVYKIVLFCTQALKSNTLYLHTTPNMKKRPPKPVVVEEGEGK